MKKRIHLIAEGAEEENFLDIVSLYGLDGDTYELSYENVGGFGKIPARFSYYFSMERFEYIYLMYDVDNFETCACLSVMNALERILGDMKKVEGISLLTNPNTMQLVASLFFPPDHKIGLKKDMYTPWLKANFENFGPKNYGAHQKQREAIKNGFDADRYEKMLECIGKMSRDYRDYPGSNIYPFLKGLQSKSTKWLYRL